MRPLRGVVKRYGAGGKVVIRCENGIEFTTDRRKEFTLGKFVEVIMKDDLARTVTSVKLWDSLRGFDVLGEEVREEEDITEEIPDDLDELCGDSCKYVDLDD
jgi:hypothetical protein